MVVSAGQGWNLSTIDSVHSNLSAHNVRDTLLHHPAGQSRTGHTVVAVCLGFILVLGILNNFLVLVVFAKFQCLWTPINLILLNISVSDILVCLFGTPFSFAASLHGRWLIGDLGCRWYGFANSLFGEMFRRGTWKGMHECAALHHCRADCFVCFDRKYNSVIQMFF